MPEKDYILEKCNKRYTAYSKMYYTVFRVGDKFKAVETKTSYSKSSNGTNTKVGGYRIEGLKKFEKHNNRECDVENADPMKMKFNRILIGERNVEEKVHEMLQGIKIRTNGIVAREILLSGGNGFFVALNPIEQEKWVQKNVEFLKKEFGENCVYACLHLDETTAHIHALIVPRFYNEEKKRYELRHNVYFDGPEKLRNWQDKYTDSMYETFKFFKRGIRGSKAKHIDLKTYYSLINEDMNKYEAKSVQAYAKENFINKKKVEELQQTLDSQEATMEACQKIIDNNKKLKSSNELYKHTIRMLAMKYDVPDNQVKDILDKAAKDSKSKDKSAQRERD